MPPGTKKDILKVAIQGEPGSFHEIAALRYYSEPVALTYCRTFAEVFHLLKATLVDRAFVAAKNSYHGTIEEVDLLVKSGSYQTEGTYRLPIQQHIIGLAHTELSQITEVISHPVALSQSSRYLNSLGAKLTYYHDTAAAVEYIKRLNNPTIVAVAGEQAAKLHGLAILKREIQNDPNNSTIFISVVH